MIELDGIADYWRLIAYAVGAGAVGGYVASLLPRGSISAGRSTIIGAAAAVAIMVVLPPTEQSVSVIGDEPVVTTQFNLIQLLATAIIAGSAGPRVFAALQDRTVAALAEERKDTVAQVAQEQLAHLNDQAQAALKEGVAHSAEPVLLEAAQLDPSSAASQMPMLVDAVAARSADSLGLAFAEQVSGAQDMIAKVASRGDEPQ